MSISQLFFLFIQFFVGLIIRIFDKVTGNLRLLQKRKLSLPLVSQITSAVDETSVESIKKRLIGRMKSYSESNEDWLLLHSDSFHEIQIFQQKTQTNKQLCFKICSRMYDVDGKSVFYQYWNPECRLKWDSYCDKNQLIGQVSESNTQIVYFKTKPIWPASSRDALLLNVSLVEGNQWFNLYTDLEACPALLASCNLPQSLTIGSLRMTVNLLGQQITNNKEENGRRFVDIVQIIDGSPNGWLPGNVIKFSKSHFLLFIFSLSLSTCVATTKSIPKQLCTIYDLLPKVFNQSELEKIPVTKDEFLQRLLEKISTLESKLDVMVERQQQKEKKTTLLMKARRTGGVFFGSLLVHVLAFQVAKRMSAKM